MINVRPARTEEDAALAGIGIAAWRKGIKPHVPAHVAARIEAENPFLPFVRELGSRLLVAECDGEAAGIAASEHADNQISDVWVAPAFEGRGVGSALVKAMEREIAGRGFADVLIQAAAANARAHGLYRHLGYKEIWRRTAFDPILETELEKVGLSKRIAQAST